LRGCRIGIVLSAEARRRPVRRRRDEPSRSLARPRSTADAPDPRSALEALCRELGAISGLNVRPHVLSSYESLLKRLDWGVIDLAWLPPVVALRAITRCGATPIAVPMRGDTSWFWTALFVRPDSPVRALADLAGTRAVWVDPDSASGYLMPRASLSAEGIDPDSTFREEVFASAHDAVVREVLEDPTSVGATFVHFDDDGHVFRAGWGSERVRLLKTAGPIPADLLAAASTAPAELVAAVRRALLEGGSEEVVRAAQLLFAATRFTAVERAHLAHLELLGRSLSALPRRSTPRRLAPGVLDSRGPPPGPGTVSVRQSLGVLATRKAR